MSDANAASVGATNGNANNGNHSDTGIAAVDVKPPLPITPPKASAHDSETPSKKRKSTADTEAEEDDEDDDSEGGEGASSGNNKEKKSGRRKISIEFIEDKSRRHITFSKRKAGIMKKAYELSTLTGTQVLLLVASETGHVYTFATPKLQPLITKPEGKNLIQQCLNSQESGSHDQSSSRSNYDAPENHSEHLVEPKREPPTYPQPSMGNVQYPPNYANALAGLPHMPQLTMIPPNTYISGFTQSSPGSLGFSSAHPPQYMNPPPNLQPKK